MSTAVARVRAAPGSSATTWRGGSGNTDHGTPDDLYEAIAGRWGPFDFDAAATAENTKVVGAFVSPEDDAFEADWREWGEVAYLNPPYGRGVTGRWLSLARRWSGHGLTVVCLVPASVGTLWWDEHVGPHADEIVFLTGRVHFEREGNSGGAGYDSAIVVYRPPFGWPHWRAR